MKTIKEFLVKQKISKNNNKFGYTLDDLTGQMLDKEDIKEGMYVTLKWMDPLSSRKVYGLVHKYYREGEHEKIHNSDFIWYYCMIDLGGKTSDKLNGKEPDIYSIMGAGSTENDTQLFIMTKDEYRYFIKRMKEDNINIPKDLLLE